MQNHSKGTLTPMIPRTISQVTVRRTHVVLIYDFRWCKNTLLLTFKRNACVIMLSYVLFENHPKHVFALRAKYTPTIVRLELKGVAAVLCIETNPYL